MTASLSPHAPCYTRTLLLGFVCAALTGCVATIEDPDGNGDEVAVVTAALNGTVKFPDTSCDKKTASGESFQTIIRAAMTEAHRTLTSSAMSDCMRHSVFNWTYDSPEQVLARMKANMPTEVVCADLEGLGEANHGLTNERLTLDNDFIRGRDSADIAATILHEVAHNKDYRHASKSNNNATPDLKYFDVADYWITVPEQIEACSYDISQNYITPTPNGLRRDWMVQETTLAPSGGMGGNQFRMTCNIGTGVKVRAGAAIDAVGLHCMGPETPLVGGTGGTRYDMLCTGAEALVGVFGSEKDGRLESLAAVCQNTSSIIAHNRTNLRWGQWYGGSAGIYFDRLCPPGMVVTGLRGRSGSRVDRLQLDCAAIGSQFSLPNETFLSWSGGSGGTLKLEQCVGRAALDGLTFQTETYVNRLGGLCSEIGTTCNGGVCSEHVVASRRQAMQSHGGSGGRVGQQSCAFGSALVGLRVRAGTYMDAIGGVCANANAWSGTGAAPATTNLPLAGGSGGTLVTRMCPRGSFLTGWEIRSGSLVDAVRPICRDFSW